MLRRKVYIINHPPVAWKRAGLNGHMFYDRQKQEKLLWGISLIAQHNDEPPFTKPVEIDVTFYLPRPAKPKYRDAPTGVDIDNLVKMLLDSMSKNTILSDDRIVIDIHARKRYDKDRPRTEFTIQEMNQSKYEEHCKYMENNNEEPLFCSCSCEVCVARTHEYNLKKAEANGKKG